MSVEIGDFKMGPGVLELIIGLATVEVEGVVALSGGVISSISDWLKGGATKGVRVAPADEVVDVDVHLVMDYGKVIPDVARMVQANVKKAVESMTSCRLGSIDVYVEGLAESSQS
ncbi:MAG: Asp23/Gls24 family envelope stress response protein [Candidatus Aquicultorales bacterium]